MENNELAVEFVWLWLEEKSEKMISAVSRAVEIAEKTDAMIETIFPPVLTFYFGALPHLKFPTTARSDLVENLRKEFGSNAKAYHGKSVAFVGNIGSPTRFSYSVILREHGALLSDLSALPRGEYRLDEKEADQVRRECCSK